MRTIAAVLFGGALAWAVYAYGATETQNHHRVFLLCLIPTLLVAWTVVSSRHLLLFACLGFVLLLNISLQPTLEAEGYVIAALGWMTLFIVVELSAYSAAAMRRFALLVAMVGAAEAVYGLVQYFGELPDSRGFVSGTLVNRNHFAALLNISIPLAIGLTFGGFSRRVRAGVPGSEVRAWGWLIVLACALMGLAVLLSGSRAATVTLISTLLFLCLMLAAKRRTRRGTSLPTAYASILLFTILGLALWAGAAALLERFAEVESGLSDRAAISAASLQLIVDHPWAGVGPGMYRWRFRPYQPGSADVWYDHAHNDYLQVAAEWGLPVAVAFWGLVVWSFLASARFFLAERRDTWAQAISIGCSGALLSILLHSTVDFNLQIPSNLMVFCIVLGLSFAVRLRSQEGHDPMKRFRTLVSLLLTLACFWSGVNVFERLVAWQLFRNDSSPEGVKQALRWDPRRPDFHFQLGLTRRDIPEHQDLGESISSLERAVSLNPYRWDYLNELARGYELAGREADAVRLYRESVRINPRSALYRWRLANYYLRTLGLGQSLGNFRKTLTLDPSYTRPAAHLLSLAGATAQDLVMMCPGQARPRLALLEFLETDDKHPAELIDRLWADLMTSNPPPSLSDGAFHLDYLRRKGRSEEARKNWISLCRMSRIVDAAFERRANLVWNGGFELPVFGVGLDWHVSPGKTHSVRLAKGEGMSGSTGFRIDFNGQANPDLAVLKQTILLTSGGEHKLTFRTRSRSLTSDRGIYLQVIDTATSSPLVASPEIRGTRDWQEVVLLIPSDPSSADTKAVDLVLRRDRSWRIDSKLGGSAWLDDVVIRQVDPDS